MAMQEQRHDQLREKKPKTSGVLACGVNFLVKSLLVAPVSRDYLGSVPPFVAGMEDGGHHGDDEVSGE